MTVDHVAVALSRLPQQIIDLPNFQAVLSAIIQPFQDAEDAFQDLLLNRGVLTATGVTLTSIGNLVGEPRATLDDDEYRRRIRARIFTNRSSGTIDELVRITQLMMFEGTFTFVFEKQIVGVFVVRVTPVTGSGPSHDTADLLISFLREATSADGRTILESTTGTTVTRGQFDISVFDSSYVFTDARD